MPNILKIAFVLLVLAVFTSCGDNPGFLQNDDSAAVVQTQTGVAPPPSGAVSTQSIDQLCASANVTKVVRQVTFGALHDTCAWNQNGNLGQRDSYIQARSEQTVSVTLPDHAVVCEMSLAAPSQKLEFDDEIMLFYDNYLLVGSADYSDRLPKDGIFSKYDWASLAGSRYTDRSVNASTEYCVGSPVDSSCKLPFTEKIGEINLSFDSKIVHQLSALTSGLNQFNFLLVTTGDNDKTDCQHTAFSMNVSVSYAMTQ